MNMLESFEISNFRLFQSLKVTKLNRVNLIVGQNNAGKSAFLEAIELYISNASLEVLVKLVESRQETWRTDTPSQSHHRFNNSIRHLFFGYQLPQLEEMGIILGEIASDKKLHLKVAAYQTQDDDETLIKRVRILEDNLDHLDQDLLNIEFVLIAKEGEKDRRLFRLDRDIRDVRRFSTYSLRINNENFKYNYQIVSTQNMPNQKLSNLWDLTSITPLAKEVISALKLIDNRVSGVTFVNNIAPSISISYLDNDRIPMIKMEGIDELLPLKSMGDGMTRLFNIIVAIVNAKNGILLIDEFENGLHWTVQPKIWDIIFQLAEKLNVQVFATTHSRDCIKGFDQAWNQYPNLGAFFRLDIKEGGIKATEYTSETLTDAIEMDVEVR